MKEFFRFIEPPDRPQSLEEAVRTVFPDTIPRRLRAWLARVRCESGAAPEALLFITLICGLIFRITHPEVTSVLRDLSRWLRSGGMGKELAEILTEAWTPGVVKVVAQRGWRRGWPEGPSIRKKGRPPEARGAWVAARLVEQALRTAGGQTPSVIPLAAELAAVLLARESLEKNTSEYYRQRKAIAQGDVPDLCKRLTSVYEFVLTQEGIHQSAPPPPMEEKDQFEQWREEHKGLSYLLRNFGIEGVGRWVLARIPHNLWEPFWQSADPSTTGNRSRKSSSV